ncbi:hypothetical protein KKC94_05370 [Patescibacteria group bacterium]|nr:hypothetical protein [Patescibacteria group bacterium]
MHKVLIGLVSYNDLEYLKDVVPILEQLRVTLPADVAVLDSAHSNDVRDFFKKKFPEILYFRHKDGNVGYGRGLSAILKKNPGHKYYLVTTNDVLLDVSTSQKAVKMMEHDKTIAMCSGKLYHWDREKGLRTRIIDTLGVQAERNHHFYERGAGEEDHGQYDESLQDFFGISGASFLIRTSVIPDLHGEDWRLFDERMWMYKEDVDLSYRLRWLGEKLYLMPEVWGWHARTASNMEGQGAGNLVRAQKGKADYTRRNSYKNHILLLKNNFSWRNGPEVILRTFLFESAKGIYMLFRHPSVFFGGMRTLLFVRGRRSKRLVSAHEILSFFK